MSERVQEKFSALRRRLDQLGYRQPLGVESLPLVEKLFADLLHTTESLKNAKLASVKSPREKADIEAQVEPYKNDNSRLVKENNDLHLQLIRTKEEADKSVAGFKAALRKLEHENNDLKFLNNQYVHKIRVIERESKEKSDHILKLQEKNFNAVIQTPGGKKKHVPFRRQRLLLDSTIPASNSSSAPVVPLRDDPFVADLLKVADNRIAELEQQLELIKDKNIGLEGKMATYSRQVEARDAEIERLGRVLDGGRPYDVVALEARNKSNEKLISHLNIQIDYLQQKNKDLEKQLDNAKRTEALARQHAATTDIEKNDLEASLKDADRTAKRLEQDRIAVIGVADKELAEAKLELTKYKHELEFQDKELSRMRTEAEKLRKENKKLYDDFVSQTADFDRLEGIVDKTQEDKRKLGLRVNRLIQKEKELVTEIDKLKRIKRAPGYQSSKLRNRSPNRFDQLIKNVEQERDYWKAEVERLQEVLTYKRIGTSPIKSPEVSLMKASKSPVRESRSCKKSSASKTRIDTGKARSPSAGGNRNELAMEKVIEERDFYKREYEMARDELRERRVTSPDHHPRSPSHLKESFGERGNLKTGLDNANVQLSETRRELKSVVSERDHIQEMYENTMTELNNARQQLLASVPAKSSSLATQHIIKQVEKERDDALANLHQTMTERTSLRNRLQVATETQIQERLSYDDKIEELHKKIRNLTNERSELEAQICALRNQISQLEEEVRVQAARYNEETEKTYQLKHELGQIRVLLAETEKSLQDTQQRLEIKENDLQTERVKCEELTNRLTESDRVNANMRNEVNQMRMTVAALDREKDNLQSILDEKTENLVRLDDECASQEQKVSQLLSSNREKTRQLDQNDDTMKLKDREIHSLRRQIDGLNVELNDTSRAKDEQARENRLLEDDLANMTAENQRLSTDIRELIDERARLSDQIQEYISEVKRVEDVLAQKEEERTQLLEQYKALSVEAERYETQTNQLEGQAQNMRRELQTKEQNIRRLQENIELMDKELQQTQMSYHSLENQITNQSRVIDNLEQKVSELETERYNLEQDMAASRDLSVRLEHNKDSVQRKLAAKELECERSRDTIQELEREIAALKDRNHTDRQELVDLEQLLASNREKEFQAQLALQETTSEIQLMKDRLTLNDSKIESQAREISQLRNRVHDLEADLERSRRQLTNERFEREKTAQELRRVTEMSRSQLNRSGHVTPASLARSGITTSSNQFSPTKVFSPAPSRGRSPTSVRSVYSVAGSQTANAAADGTQSVEQVQSTYSGSALKLPDNSSS